MSTTGQSARNASLSTYATALWLFTVSDLKTILIPSTIFAVICNLDASVGKKAFGPGSSANLITNTFSTIIWVWLNLVIFTIENQRTPESIREDQENKPWRPLPSGVITPESAVTILRYTYLVVILVSLKLGGLRQALFLIIFGYGYSHLGGGDRSFILRNLLSSGGYMCFLWGAVEVMQQTPASSLPPKTLRWILVIGAVILTTIHISDIPDQVGDRARDRRTLPLVIGDVPCRWTIAAFVGAWSFYCPFFWGANGIGFAILNLLGALVAGRILSLRDVKADKVSWRIFNIWVVAVYSLPLFAKRG